MPTIFLPRRWRRQPQGAVEVNQSHPTARGLVFACAPPNNGGEDLIGRTIGNSPGTGPTRGFRGGDYLAPIMYRQGGTTEQGWIWPAQATGMDFIAGPFTLLAVCGFVNGAMRDVFGSRSFITGAAVGLRVDDIAQANNTVLYYAQNGTIGNAGGNFLGVSAEERMHCVAITGNGTTVRFFRRFGERVDIARTSLPTLHSSRQTVVFGLSPVVTSEVPIAFVGAWDREIPIAETQAMVDEPWQLFRAPSHRIWFDVGAGASGTTYNESLTESATLGDSLDPLASFFASYAESVTAGDSAANAQTHAVALSESVTPADSATSAQSHAETLAESVTADDSAAPAQTMPVALSEDVTAGDALADEVVPAGSFNETIAESATVDDAYASTQAHVEALAEQISVGDGYTVTGGTEVEQRRGAPAGPPLRIWRYSARIGGRMVYADTQQALQAAIAEFEDSVPARAEKKAQKAGKVVVRRLPKVQIVDAPEEERGQVQAQAQAANDRIAAEYLAALQAQIAIREAMERDDMEAITVLEFL